MNKSIITLIGASSLLLSSAGLAAATSVDSNPVDNSAAFYLNANVGYGHNDVSKDVSRAFGITKIDRNSFAFSANAGYQFNPNFALEAGYMRLPYIEISFPNGKVESKVNAYTLAAKGIYPVNQKFDVFGKAGIALLSESIEIPANGFTITGRSDSYRITPLFALGVDYNLTKRVAISVQGVATLKSGDSIPATYTGLVGLTYKFS